MKIAVASDDGKTIAEHFGRTQGFMIYEISEKGEIVSKTYRQNNHTHHKQGHQDNRNLGEHHGHDHGTVLVLLKDTQAVISRGMGRRILYDLDNAGIKPFIVTVMDADEALEKYLQDQLESDLNRQCNH